MPTGKKQTKKEVKMRHFKEALGRNEARAERSDKDQLKLLDSKNLIAKKERNRLTKRIKEKEE